MMKTLNVIFFKDESEVEKYSEAICEKLSRSNLSAEQEFCGIWGEIQFNDYECLATISSTVNWFLKSEDKNEVYFGCCKENYKEIMSLIDMANCEINILYGSDFES